MMNTITADTTELFVEKICDLISISSDRCIKAAGKFTFVLSGGRTPKLIFDKLASSYKAKIDWSKVHLFWVDERCVEVTSIDSNYYLAMNHLISKLDQIGSLNRIEAEKEPVLAARLYTKSLEEFFGHSSKIKFDAILLGMGDDGHVASLFPNSSELNSSKHVVATSKKYNGYFRITLNLNTINRSSEKILMVNSAAKFEKLLSNHPDFPINKVTDKTIVYLNKG